LIDGKKREYPMAGVYPFKSKMYPTLRMLGYREVFFEGKSFLPAGKSARGHEFRYSALENSSARAQGVGRAYAARAAKKAEICAGYVYKNCVAGYAHLHFGSNRKLAEKFVAACRR
jgi:cobyrinic acid a,c-diamide synthase